jgi:hypothetical protein
VAGWIKDGTWPIDPATSRAVRPPDSPFLGPIPPLRTTSLLPDEVANREGVSDIPGISLDGVGEQTARAQDGSRLEGDGVNSGGIREPGDRRPENVGEGLSDSRGVQDAIADAVAELLPLSIPETHPHRAQDEGTTRRIAQVEQAMVDMLVNDERDVRIGDNVWRGGQADEVLPLR